MNQFGASARLSLTKASSHSLNYLLLSLVTFHLGCSVLGLFLLEEDDHIGGACSEKSIQRRVTGKAQYCTIGIEQPRAEQRQANIQASELLAHREALKFVLFCFSSCR